MLPESYLTALTYLPLIGLVWASYTMLGRRRTRRALAIQRTNREAGLIEPMSLHPVIDPSRCLGSGTCITACPEHDVLGMVHGKAILIGPSDCIGHGACKDACPVDAITLVLGTETRGIDIPVIDADFQTNVPGIFVAGELGGMGLIRNAIEQGRQAMDAVRRLPATGAGADLDVVIIGAGPAGFSASLGALEHGLRFVTLEQETLGGTVAHYPRGKIVMTAPAHLPIAGEVKIRETTKEALLELWVGIEKQTQLKINYLEQVTGITKSEDGFQVTSTRGSYRTRAVVLAIGRRGTPRKLGVPGEEQNKVVYRLIDPEQYRGQSVLVVGGGDSALEAAWSLADVAGTEVAISYRSDAFSRAKPKNRANVENAASFRGLRVMMGSQVKEIRSCEVLVETADGAACLENDAVIVCAGGVMPNDFLESFGVQMATARGKEM